MRASHEAVCFAGFPIAYERLLTIASGTLVFLGKLTVWSESTKWMSTLRALECIAHPLEAGQLSPQLLLRDSCHRGARVTLEELCRPREGAGGAVLQGGLGRLLAWVRPRCFIPSFPVLQCCVTPCFCSVQLMSVAWLPMGLAPCLTGGALQKMRRAQTALLCEQGFFCNSIIEYDILERQCCRVKQRALPCSSSFDAVADVWSCCPLATNQAMCNDRPNMQ